MKTRRNPQPTGKLSEVITKTFSSFNEFKKQFSDTANNKLGSGRVWLCHDDKGNLFINPQSENQYQLTEFTEEPGMPLVQMNVWDHHYLKYQNKSTDYLNLFWNTVNWDEVAEKYEKVIL